MKLEIQRLDHWGIVAGIMKDLGFTELINEAIGTDKQEILTTGDIVAGMVINGLGFASRPLMLAPQFFENKPLEMLIKPNITADHFNRHRIGRALDVISEFGCEKLFNTLALSACKTENVITRFAHADTTSYSLCGDYETLDENDNPIEHEIQITYGYSKAKRPDLKQIIQELVTSQDGGIPLMTKTLSGNASDNKILRERAESIMKEFNRSSSNCLVADSKLYAAETAPILNQMNFITRVPATIKLEKECISKALSQPSLWQVFPAGYKCQSFSVNHYDIKDQRWIVFYSQQAYDRSKKTLTRELEKEQKSIVKSLEKFQEKLLTREFDEQEVSWNLMVLRPSNKVAKIPKQ